jgi:hypothetical protein
VPKKDLALQAIAYNHCITHGIDGQLLRNGMDQ